MFVCCNVSLVDLRQAQMSDRSNSTHRTANSHFVNKKSF